MFIRLLLLSLTFSLISCKGNTLQYEDICGHLNNRRIYLELGDIGYLTADHTNFDLTLKNQTVHNECNLEIITCPSCLIRVKFT